MPVHSAHDLISVALTEVGYQEVYDADLALEDPAGGGWGNLNKYAAELIDAGLMPARVQGHAYCSLGVAWCAWKLGALDLLPFTSWNATGVARYKSWGRWFDAHEDNVQIGDQAFFGPGGGSHTAIVYALSDRHIATIDFNTNPQNWPPSDYAMGVYLRVRDREDPFLHGYGRPRYGEDVG